MDELLKGAQRLANAGKQREIAAATSKTAEQAEWAALRRTANRRLQKFVGHLVSHDVSPVTLYEPQERIRQRGPFLGPQTYTSSHARVGVGWLAREAGYSYEESLIDGIFIAKANLAVVPCWEAKRETPTGVRDIHTEECVVAKYGRNLDASPAPEPPENIYLPPPLFATDEGKHMLEAALVRYGVVRAE
jgi:hypothetical protein